MLTQIRHIQKGTLIVVTIIIVIAFAFLYSDFDFGQGRLGTQNCVIKVYDRCVRVKEVQKLSSYYDVALQLGMGEFAQSLFGENRLDNDRTNFVLSLLILRTEAEKIGIEPSAEEIKAAIPDLPIFQRPFVDAAFLENNVLGPNGFTDGDLAQLVKDYLTFQKLRDLIGVGLASVPSETDKLYVRANQNYTASLIDFDREAVAEGVKVSDEEIGTYYEENKDNLMSEVKRGFHYAKFFPKELPEDATNEQRAKSEQAFLNAINHAYADLAEEGEMFDEIAKQYEGEKTDYTMESGSYEPFSSGDAPESIAEDQSVLEQIFSEALQLNGVTVPMPAGDGSYFVFLLSEQEEPQPMTLEEAKPAIERALIARNSNRAVNDAANAARAAINEALEAGKSFDEAVKVAEVKAEALPTFAINKMPEEFENQDQITVAVGEMGENELSDVIEAPGGEGYFLIYVDKIVLYEDEDAEATKRSIASSVETALRYRLFDAWFNQRKMESGSGRVIATLPTEEEG